MRQPVNHTEDLSPSAGTPSSVCQGREQRKDSVWPGGSHAQLTSHPAVTLVCFHVYLEEIKGMIAQE